MEISGNNNEVVNVEGDFKVGGTYTQEKPVFFEPSFDKFKTSSKHGFIKPIVGEFLRTLQNDHLLILGGAYPYKLDVARYCSWTLSAHLASRSRSSKTAPRVREWYRSSNPQSITVKLEEVDDETIFILPEIDPYDINYDLDGIKRAIKKESFVLVTTNTPEADWKIPDTIRCQCWKEPSADELYRLGDLAEYLKKRLGKTKSDIHFRVETSESENGIDRVAERLKTPEKIDVFIQLLLQETNELTKEKIQNLIRLAQNDTQIISHWFHHLLDPREQLLALGLSFFDGLLEDQCFSAIEKVVEKAWKLRVASLSFLDYGDLKNLMNYFHFVKAAEELSKIESRFPNQRKSILKVAWDTHRRQILAALPVLVDLARDSVAGRSRHPELYSTPTRRDQLRRVIGETISEIGLLSVNSVEETLLQLAADHEIGVQAVAARSMARWQQNENATKLFPLLKRWRKETRFIELISTIFQERGVERGQNASSFIRTTVSLTLGYAARFTAPNQLDDNLIELFRPVRTMQIGASRIS